MLNSQLLLNLNKLHRHIMDTLLQRAELDAELGPDLGGIDIVRVGEGLVRVALGRQVSPLGEVLAQDVADLLEGVAARGAQVALAGGGRVLVGAHMGLADVADVDPEVEGGRGHLLLAAVHEVVDLGGRRVQLAEVGHGVGRGAVHHGRADGGDVEVGVVLGDVVEGGLLGQLLGGAVGDGAGGVLLRSLLVGDGVPVLLGVGVAWSQTLVQVEDRGEGGGDDNALHVGVVLLDRFQDFGGAPDGGLEEIALVVLD